MGDSASRRAWRSRISLQILPWLDVNPISVLRLAITCSDLFFRMADGLIRFSLWK